MLLEGSLSLYVTIEEVNSRQKVSKLKGNMDDDEWMFSEASNIRVGNTLGRPTSVFLYDINMDWIEQEK